jgi:hypothetical protein
MPPEHPEIPCQLKSSVIGVSDSAEVAATHDIKPSVAALPENLIILELSIVRRRPSAGEPWAHFRDLSHWPLGRHPPSRG